MKTFNTFIDRIRISDWVNEIQAELLGRVYDKVDLQTPGQAEVHWSNITNKPSGELSGDVYGPESANVGEVAVFNGIDGKTLKPVPVSISDEGGIDIPLGETYNINGEPHTHTGFEPAFTKNTAFNKDFGVDGGTICEGNDSRIHVHDNSNVLNGFGVDINSKLLYYGEPVKVEQQEIKPAGYNGYIQINDNGKLGGIQPRSGFNKDFGTSSGTIATGDHVHIGIYEPVILKNTAFNKDFGSTAGTITEGNDSRLHTHDNGNVLTLLADENGHLKYNGVLLASGTGDVSGPASSTINHVAVYGDPTGKLLKDGGALGPAAFAPFGTASGSITEGNDPRLSDARSPLSHGNESHTENYLTVNDVTFSLLSSNNLVGTGATQIASGNHTHAPDHVHTNANILAKIPSDTTAATGQVITRLANGSLGWMDVPVAGAAVTGPAASVINHIALYADATGKLLKDGGALGSAAFMNPGTTSEDVAAGDHTHTQLHTHANSDVIGQFGETDGNLTYRGLQITGASGDVTLQNPTGVSGDIQINDNGHWGAVTPKSGFNRAVGTTSGTLAAGDDYRFHVHSNGTIINKLTDMDGYLAYNGVQLVDMNSSGDVTGPVASTPGHIAVYTDTSGKKIHDGGMLGEAAFRNIGSVVDTVCSGDDSRLSDARTPLTHGDEAHSKNYLDINDITFENLKANNAVGDRSNQVAYGNHGHNQLHTHANMSTLISIPDQSTALEGQVLSKTSLGLEWRDLSGVEGDVHGPEVAPINAVALFEDDTGKRIKSGGVLGSAAWRNVGGDANQVAPGNHGHAGVYEPVFTKNPAFNKYFGTISGTVCEGNDSRIHVHTNASAINALTDVDGHLAYNGIVLQETGQGSGDVIGPADSTINHVALFADPSGKVIKDGGALGSAAFMNTGATADSVCIGNDARLYNSRTPLAHGNEKHNVPFATTSDITFYHLNLNGSVGNSKTQVSRGDHTHPNELPDYSSETVGMVLGCTSSDQLGWISTSSMGNVYGPVSSVQGAVALFASDNGKLLKQGGILGEAAYRNIGTVANSVCAGDDTRLSNARTPLAHMHAVATTASAGFCPKLTDDYGKFLRNDGTWDYPTVGSVDIIDGGEILLL